MMRVRLRGINSKRKRLADGSWRTYYYAWKGGPALRGEPGTPEFAASYNEAVAQKVKTPTGRLLSLLQAYQASEDFRQLAPRTQDATTSELFNKRLSRNTATSRCRRLRIAAHGESLWNGATGLP
jgi:hypothetical protein